MLWVAVVIILKQESASLVMDKITATPVTPESGLVQEDVLITPTRVETRLTIEEIMATNTSKPWDTSWCSDKKKTKTITEKVEQ